MNRASYPSLYQINTRILLGDWSRRLGRHATLDDIPEAALEGFAKHGFDWIWLLSVWKTGAAGRHVSRTNPEWRREFQSTLPDLQEEDICGSGFAIFDYSVSDSLGGNEALARLRQRLAQHGIQLMLDFVPNHMALDHPWIESHPDYFILGTELDLARAPKNYVRVKRSEGSALMAHGRDPYFPGWADTLQLNYGNPALQEAMIGQLNRVAELCDGVRCDMAMLVLPEVFEKTWGLPCQPFWPKAIREIRKKHADFVFMAEVYWDLEWTLQQQGFNYTYDKRLYDRLRSGNARSVREHLFAGLDYQSKMARFLENHDEPRAAATFPPGAHEAAAIITFLSPGLRFFHQGQFEGRKIKISPHLGRAPNEIIDADLAKFYQSLLEQLNRPLLRQGNWVLLECRPAWEGNRTWDSFLAFAWDSPNDGKALITVNYSPHRSQCFVRLPFPDLKNRNWHLRDLMGPYSYERDGNELETRGLYLDVAPWQTHLFAMEAMPR